MYEAMVLVVPRSSVVSTHTPHLCSRGRRLQEQEGGGDGDQEGRGSEGHAGGGGGRGAGAGVGVGRGAAEAAAVDGRDLAAELDVLGGGLVVLERLGGIGVGAGETMSVLAARRAF